MSSKRCSNSANALLAWYVNGSLDEAEDAGVAAHLDVCTICSHEVDGLLALSHALSTHGTTDRDHRFGSGAGRRLQDEQPSDAPDESARVSRARNGLRDRRPLDDFTDRSVDSPPLGSPQLRSSRLLPYLAAAALLVPALAGIYWGYLGFPGASSGRTISGTSRPPRIVGDTQPGGSGPATSNESAGREPEATRAERGADGLLTTLLLDLGAGPMRGQRDKPPILSDPGRADSIAIRFLAPIIDGTCTVELEGPAGRILLKGQPLQGIDEVGKATYSLSTKSLSAPGTYTIVVREHPGSRSSRSYRFPFVVRP